MSIIKLQDAGAEATLKIVACEAVEGTYGMQVKFDADNGDTLYVPQSSVDRQMDRIGVPEYADIVGQTIHFFRAPNSKPGGKPFWNIDRAVASDVPTPAKTNGKPVVAQALLPNENGTEEYLTGNAGPGMPKEVSGFDQLVAKYAECMDAVTELLNARKATADSQAYAAMVATLYISRNQKSV